MTGNATERMSPQRLELELEPGSDFDVLVRQQLHQWKVPGASFSLVHGDKIWSKGYGFADLESKREVDADETLHWGASTTKAHLTAAWAIYIESNANRTKAEHERISFATPLSKIIRDDFVLPDTFATESITLEDVLSMRSGMARHDMSYGREAAYTTRDAVRNLRHLPIHTHLRTTFEYCNTGYAAASHALEVVTGRALVDVLREWIWQPLGMDSTFGGYHEVQQNHQESRMARGYTWSALPHCHDFGQGEYIAEKPLDLAPVSGAGYIISTAADYGKWMYALLNNTQLLIPEVTKACFTPRIISPPDLVSGSIFDGGHLLYALGWFVASYKGHRILYHPGGLVGGGSRVLLCPSIKFGTTFLSNGFGAGERLAGLQFNLLDQALGLENNQCDGFTKVERTIVRGYADAYPPLDECVKKLYPNAPREPAVKLSLPLHDYVGTYHHIGYGSLTFTAGTDPDTGREVLRCEVADRTWPQSFVLKPINAEDWLVTTTKNWPEVRKARSRIGMEGKVQAFGIGMEPAMPECLFWFEKV